MESKLPEGWGWKKLGEVSDIIMGQSPSGETYNEKGNGMPFLQGKAEFTDSCPKHVKYTTSPSKVAPEGSILISVRAPVGDVNIANLDYCIGRGLASISLKNGDNKFLFYLLRYLKPEIENKGTGSTFKAISKSILNDITIPLPPLETQQKIVSILEKAEETKKLRAQADELTQKLLQSVFLEMFGDPVENPKDWDEKSLEDLCSHIIDCPHSTPKYEECITLYPCIRTTELKNGYIDWSEMKYISEEGYKERIKRLLPVEGDIVYGREGTYGEAIRIPNNTNICLGQRVMLFRPNHNLCNSEFLWALVRSDGIYQQALRKTSGSTVGHVNVNNIKKFTCFCPPLSLQDEFSSIVKSVEILRKNQQQSSQEMNTLFDALMQKAFTGELVA